MGVSELASCDRLIRKIYHTERLRDASRGGAIQIDYLLPFTISHRCAVHTCQRAVHVVERI